LIARCLIDALIQANSKWLRPTYLIMRMTVLCYICVIRIVALPKIIYSGPTQAATSYSSRPATVLRQPNIYLGQSLHIVPVLALPKLGNRKHISIGSANEGS
jgi:hypothetical protein